MYDIYVKNKKLSSLFSIFLMGLFSFFYAGCSESSVTSKNTVNNISGIVQKGQFLGGEVSIQSLNDKGVLLDGITTVSIDSKGTYGLTVQEKGLYLFTAKGKFFNEYTGKNSTEEVELYALVNVPEKDFSETININLFTSLEYSRVVVLMQSGSSYTDALASTRNAMQQLFGLGKDVNASDLDAYDMNGTLKEENKNLLLFSATLLKILDSTSTEKPSQKEEKEVQKFTLKGMKNFYRDFGDNGRVDGDAQQIYHDMAKDDEESTWKIAIGNLGLTEVQAPVHDWVTPGSTGTTFKITEFILKSVTLKGIEKNYSNEEAFFIGLSTDELKLKFRINSSAETPTAYTAKIYATAEGMESLVVKENISVSENRIFLDTEVNVDSILRDFFRMAYSNGKEIKFKVVSDVLSVHSYVQKNSDELPKFRELSNKLNVNNTLINIYSATYMDRLDDSCSDTNNKFDESNIQYAKFNMSINWKPSDDWKDMNGSLIHSCVELTYNSDTNLIVPTLKNNYIRFSSNQPLLRMENDSIYLVLPSNIGITIYSDGRIDGYGRTSVLTLPKDITYHYASIAEGNEFSITPESLGYLATSPLSMNISDDWDNVAIELVKEVGEYVVNPYIHVNELPFYMNLTNAEVLLNSSGVHFTNVSAKYIHQGDSSLITSNNIQFSNPTGTFNVTINEDGLQTTTPIHFAAVTDAKTHFPYTKMTQGGFDVNIVNGEITPVNVTGAGSYKLAYSSECKTASCSEEGASSTIEYTFPSSNSHMAKDGAFISDVDIDNKKIAWGSQKVDGIELKHIFERDADTKGVMYVPGFSIATNNPEELVNHLMGSRNITAGKLSTVHPLGSDESKKGNGVFAGLNVGSIEFGNENDAMSLSGKKMRVLVGGDTSLTLHNNAKSKYYIRPSGITGVFNGALEQAGDDLSIYGYPMIFKRFAFSQVANKLDEKTLVDGAISVIGDGGFKVDFSSLALDCTGALSGGLVDESDCDASPKVNCEQTLSKWKTKTQFVTVDFDSNSKDICSDKTLKIGHVLDVRALTKPLGLLTNWTAEGKPENAKVSGSSFNFLDRNEQNDESQGFAITLDSGSELTDAGWYKFSGAFGLPFWGMKAVDLGLANNSNTSQREPSRVMPRNVLTQTTYAENKEQKFMAAYQWGSTGFGFELPVVYKARNFNKESEFIGKKLEIDLGVMDAQAGINYIKPEKTKISFGASADFEAMGKLQIKIDLNDPESIHKIDDTLNTFGIGGEPIYNTIGLILDPLHKAEEYADKGLFLGMEELGVLALEKGVDELGVDPFEEVADAFVQIHALPIQAIDMTENYIVEEFDKKLAPAMQLLQNSFNDAGVVNDDIKETVDKVLETVLTSLDELERLKSQLDDVDGVLTAINMEGYWDNINDKISAIISDEGSNDETCVNFLLNDSKLFKPVRTLRTNILEVNNKLQKVDIETVKKFASKVEKKIDFDTSSLVNTFEKTQSVANSLAGEITTAQNRVDTELKAFCRESNNVRTEIEKLISKAEKFEEIRTKLQAYLSQVRGNLSDNKINDIKAKIGEVRKLVSNLGTNDMNPEQEDRLSELGSNFMLIALEGTEVDSKSINDLKNDLKDLMKKIPQPTADELRHMVITKILDTEPMQNIRITMNEAFSPVMDEVREVVVDLFASVNQVIYDVFDKLSAKANEALAEATSAVNAMPIKSGKMDGYALISGDELDRLHIGAEWEVDTGDEDTSYSFNGALDMERWGAGGKAGCGGGTSTDGNMDVKISTRDIALSLGGKKLSVDELYFGFTLQNALPVGIMGGIASVAGFDFNKFKLYDMKLLVGIGAIETYMGAKSAAIFDIYQMNAAFLLGRTCGKEILTSLDPEVGKFITLQNNVFKGAYIRGGASFPIWENGCALRVGVTADLGAWVLMPGTVGGLIGGGAYGRVLCIAALKGKVKAMFQKSGDNIKFQGKGWGAAGVGSCSPSKWYSVAKSRRDSWCATGDAQFGAEYNNGWTLLDINTNSTY